MDPVMKKQKTKSKVQPSGAQNRKKKEKKEAERKAQSGAMFKFLSSTSKTLENDEECFVKDAPNGECSVKEVLDEERLVNQVVNDNNSGNDMDDPTNWGNIDQKLIDYLVQRGPQRVDNLKFPKNTEGRHFSFKHYTQQIPSGEMADRN